MTLCACFITPMRSECSHVKLLFDVVWGCKLCAAATKSVDVAASKNGPIIFRGWSMCQPRKIKKSIF